LTNNRHPQFLLILLVGLATGICTHIQGQNQLIADSLKQVITEYGDIDSLYLEHLEDIAYNETDPSISERYADTLIELSDNLGLKENLLSGYLQKGNADLLQGNSAEALTSFFSSIEVALELKQQSKVGAIYISIADAYTLSKDFDNAIRFYGKSIAILRNSNDTISLGTVLLNIGDSYNHQSKHDSALIYLNEADNLFSNISFRLGEGYAMGNIAMAYKGLKKYDLAVNNFQSAIEILYEFQDYYPVSVYYSNLAEIYFDKGQINTALNYARQSHNFAMDLGLKEQIASSNAQLSRFYESKKDYDKAIEHLKQHYLYRDSIINIESERDKAELRADFQVKQKQVQVDLLEQQKENQRITIIASIISAILIALLAIGIFRRYRFAQKTKKIIEGEKQRSDNLLLNILPEETALELKKYGKVKAQKFDSVTVLFTDFKGFTKYAENLDPETLVESVDYYFSKFDEIIEKHDLEKIKTVGDAYMCAGGLPYPSDDHAYRMVRAAIEIADFVNASKSESNGKARFDIRIGINTGPVVAGVVGTKKFAYDIWGDTVNIASRMETNSIPGRVNISENTYNLVKDKFDCEYRGEINVKNRGALKMYFVNPQDQGAALSEPSRKADKALPRK